MDRRYLGPEELSTYLGMSVRTIYFWIAQRKIPHFKLGKRLRFDIIEIAEWLKDKKVKELS
ncbi:MAG: helix-turn-helix domain-containing protein [Candidatus Omnitrophica bacterium]|nr:helix-turn-helix domain-containing protein [Candidatus Omnitrophota bacterium]